MSRILGGWGADPLWGTVYDWMVEHPTAPDFVRESMSSYGMDPSRTH